MADESVQSPKPSLALNILNYMLVSWNGGTTEWVYGNIGTCPRTATPCVSRGDEESEKDSGIGTNITTMFGTYSSQHTTHTHFLLLQGVLDYHFSGATPTNLTFDLLREMLSVYLRLSLHRAAAAVKGGGCEVVGEIREWSEGVLIPLLRGEM